MESVLPENKKKSFNLNSLNGNRKDMHIKRMRLVYLAQEFDPLVLTNSIRVN